MNWKCNHSFVSCKSKSYNEDTVISNDEYEILLMDEQENFSSTDEKVVSKKRIKKEENFQDGNTLLIKNKVKAWIKSRLFLQKIYNCILPWKE